ncbi:protein SREK1IP1-like isoform X1 [Malaya genurostris]|uniref:protein SREK1IP1-like isoform X1 n=1 Tax=Malaya genurostris TaxID=325434 RepID=UPI0026F3A26F|nr:protein SREK1IP1-like isoform X1 [Malaya genurostris]
MDFLNCSGQKDTVRAACKKCGYAGHLTYQCRNYLKLSEFTKIRQQASRKQSTRKNVPQKDEVNFPRLPPKRDIPNLPPLPRSNPKDSAAGSQKESTSKIPPGWGNNQPQAKDDSGDLFSAEQLIVIFETMTTKLRNCRTRLDQINALGKFIIEYAM